MHRLENEKETEKKYDHRGKRRTSLKAQSMFFSHSSFVAAITITEMGDAQADVREDIFANPLGPKLSAADMGERFKKELAEAKKRKKSASTLDKAEQEVLKQRKDLYKKLVR